jgi:hypothetical protein
VMVSQGANPEFLPPSPKEPEARKHEPEKTV